MPFRIVFVVMLIATATLKSSAQQVCSLKAAKSGQGAESAFRVTPCVWTSSSPVLTGAALTSIKSNPSGAELIIDGVVLAKTPAIVILEQRGDRAKSFRVAIRKDGYEGGSINVKDGDTLFIELKTKQSGGSQQAVSATDKNLSHANNLQTVAQERCHSREWTNAFQPDQPVFPKITDHCPADERKPLFTREGTLACPSPESMLYASSAMDHGWVYAGELAGITDPVPVSHLGQSVSAAYYGCTIYHEGVAVQLTEQTTPLTSAINTNIGWVFPSNLKN